MTSKSRFVKLGLSVGIIIAVVLIWFAYADDGGCSGTKQFTMDYKILNSEEYRGTNVNMKEGIPLQHFTLNRGNCTNPNTFVWNNLTDHDVIFSADFVSQDKDITIRPKGNYSFTFSNKGKYKYNIGGTEDSITIN